MAASGGQQQPLAGDRRFFALIRALYADVRRLKLDWEDGLTHIIFHGAPGAVVRAGLAAAGQLTRDPENPGAIMPLHQSARPMGDWIHPDYAQRMGPEVILCSDLTALPDGSGPDSAVWLWQQDRTGSMAGIMELED